LVSCRGWLVAGRGDVFAWQRAWNVSTSRQRRRVWVLTADRILPRASGV
jgi:hypothetical protein